MRSQACTKVIDELVRIISSYGLEPDARANTESVYYKMEPNGLLQNFMRIANHAPTVKQMFGNDHQTFPSTEENGNITIYIYDKNIDIANQNAHPNNPNKISDYLNPKYRTEKISANKFRRLENLYQKDSNGNIVFNYTMYIFEVTKLINDNLDSFNQPAVNSIGEEAYNWFMANGVNELIITDDSRVALKDIVRCQGIVRDGSVNEFSSYSKNIDFKMGNLILVDDNGKEVGKKEVILHIEKISSYLLEDFMKLYGNPVSKFFDKVLSQEELDAIEFEKKYKNMDEAYQRTLREWINSQK